MFRVLCKVSFQSIRANAWQNVTILITREPAEWEANEFMLLRTTFVLAALVGLSSCRPSQTRSRHPARNRIDRLLFTGHERREVSGRIHDCEFPDKLHELTG